MANSFAESPSDMKKCIEEIISEYKSKIKTKKFEICITSIKFNQDNITLIIGDINGNIHKYDLNTEIFFSLEGNKHTSAITSICIISLSEFATSEINSKIVIWKKDLPVHETITENPIKSMIFEDFFIWTSNASTEMTRYKFTYPQLINPQVFELSKENPQNIQSIFVNSSLSLLYNSENSIEIFDVTRFSMIDSLKVGNVLAICYVFNFAVVIYSVRNEGIYSWSYSDGVIKSFGDSEGNWDSLLCVDGSVLVSAGACVSKFWVKFWNIAEKNCLFAIEVSSRPLIMLKSDSEEWLLCYCDDQSLTSYSLKEEIFEKSIQSNEKVNDFQVYQNKIVTVGDRFVKFQEKVIDFEGNILCCAIHASKLAFSEGQSVKILNLETLQIVKSNLFGNYQIKSINYSKNGESLIILCGDNISSEILVYDHVKDQMIDRIVIKQIIYDTKVLSNAILYTSDDSIHCKRFGIGEIETFSRTLAKKKLKLCLNYSESEVFCAGSNGIVDNLTLFVNEFSPWKFEGICASFSINSNLDLTSLGLINQDIQSMILTTDEKFLILSVLNKGIQFLKIQDQLIVWKYEFNNTKLTKIIHDNNFLYLNLKNEILMMKSPFFKSNNNETNMGEISKNEHKIFSLGPNCFSFFALGIVNDFYSNGKICDKSIYDWVFFPKCLNILHIYAYKQDSSLVQSALSAKCKFFRTIENISPLTISLTLKNKHLIETLVAKIAEICKENPKILSIIENELPWLNYISPNSLSKLYENAFPKVNQTGLRKYGVLMGKSGMLMKSPSFLIEENDFLANSQYSTEEIHLGYRVSAFRMNFNLGNKESIEFLESLCDCIDHDAFHTPIIKAIVYYKWKQVRVYVYTQNLVYLAFVITTLFYGPIEAGYNIWWQLVLFILNSLFFVYECLQMSVGSKNYLKNVWNIFDLLRIICAYVFLVLKYIYNENQLSRDDFYMSVVIIFLVLLTLVKGLSFFECFTSTRSMIRILLAIIKDSFYFLSILGSATLNFTVLFMIMSIGTSGEFVITRSFKEAFQITYRLSFGDFDIDNYNNLELIVFHIATLINPLLMFNLLVSIMSDTFARLKGNLIAEDIKALAELITEIESVMVWKKSQGKKEFLQSCAQEIEEVLVDKRLKKIENLTAEVQNLYHRVKALEKFSNEKNDEFVNKISKIRQEETDGMKKISNEETKFSSMLLKLM